MSDAPNFPTPGEPGGGVSVKVIPAKRLKLDEQSALGSPSRLRYFKEMLLGQPIATEAAGHERLSKVKALAIFASDALSSVAYATEATLFVLITAFATSRPNDYVIPISGVICLLIVLVVNSYRQTVHAYPHGGGSYIVSKDNLGVNYGLVAAAAILIDYTLTVAVSVSAGVAAVTSAFPSLNGSQIIIGVVLILLLMIVNLRGVRESGAIFAAPTYLFIVSFLGLLIYGGIRVASGDYKPLPLNPETAVIPGFDSHPLTIFLLLQAFAAGCSALTGVEAISDGVQAFKKPEPRNAAITLIVMGSLLIVFFAGTSFLAVQLNALPIEPSSKDYQTVISQIGGNLLGNSSLFYYIIQASTALILILAANTAFADFPRLSYFLARDKFMPNIFLLRGDRLAYSTGIIVLAILASVLLAVFNGHTESLIPLYAVGVFLAFTLSQSGMVVHWQKKKGQGVKGVARSQFFNLIGALATGAVLVIIVITKFLSGAWLVIILIPLLFMMFKLINRHYSEVKAQIEPPHNLTGAEVARQLFVNRERKHTVLVPIAAVNKVSLATLDFAHSLGDDVTAVFISDDHEAIEKLSQEWQHYQVDTQLVILENPYRSIVRPLLNYVEVTDRIDPDDVVIVVLPEFVSRHWWERWLHNQTANRIKSSLLERNNLVIVDVPYHMERKK